MHEACVYSDDQELLSLVVPFAQDAAAAGEATVFVLSEPTAELLHPEVCDLAGVTFVPSAYEQPACAVRALLDLFDGHVASGGRGRLRLVGEILAPTPSVWEPWARYEAAGNRIFADYPAWAVCIYNRQTTPASVLAEVQRTHPLIATADGHRPNDHFQAPEAFLRARPEPAPDPLEDTPPDVELDDPMPAAARRALADAARLTSLDQQAIDDFAVSLSEVVTNVHVHGRLPAVLRLWTDDDRLHATVTDAGHGPADPFAGLRPARPTNVHHGLGLGLWIAHQLCSRVTHAAHPHGGFTVRLTTYA